MFGKALLKPESICSARDELKKEEKTVV